MAKTVTDKNVRKSIPLYLDYFDDDMGELAGLNFHDKGVIITALIEYARYGEPTSTKELIQNDRLLKTIFGTLQKNEDRAKATWYRVQGRYKKECISCGETISKKATICPFCQSEQVEPDISKISEIAENSETSLIQTPTPQKENTQEEWGSMNECDWGIIAEALNAKLDREQAKQFWKTSKIDEILEILQTCGDLETELSCANQTAVWEYYAISMGIEIAPF